MLMYSMAAIHFVHVGLQHFFMGMNNRKVFAELEENRGTKGIYQKVTQEFEFLRSVLQGVNLVVTLAAGVGVIVFLFATDSCQHYYANWMRIDAIVMILSLPTYYALQALDKRKLFLVGKR